MIPMHNSAEQRVRPWLVRIWHDLSILRRACLCGHFPYSLQRLRADHEVLARPSSSLQRMSCRVLRLRSLPTLVVQGKHGCVPVPLTLSHARYLFHRTPELERALFPEADDDA